MKPMTWMRVFGVGRGRSGSPVTASVALARAEGLLMMVTACRRGDFDPTARRNGMDWPATGRRLMGTSAVDALVIWAGLLAAAGVLGKFGLARASGAPTH